MRTNRLFVQSSQGSQTHHFESDSKAGSGVGTLHGGRRNVPVCSGWRLLAGKLGVARRAVGHPV